MKFEGEVSRAGVALCGESFMAGTICSDREGHESGHSTICVDCGGDWYNQTCTCRRYCKECGADFDDADATLCPDCTPEDEVA